MGSLTDDSRHTYRLVSRHLIGRSPTVSQVIPAQDISGEHAVLAWDGTRWTLRDLGSRNGTWLDGTRLEPGTSHPVSIGQRIELGLARHGFTVVAVTPPAPAARSGHRFVEGETDWLILPSPEAPEVLVLADPELGWVAIQDGTTRAVGHADVLEAGGLAWELDLPVGVQPTVEQREVIANLELSFRVSPDEEHVEVDVVVGDKVHSLRPRAHHYVLLTLARLRTADAERGVATSEQGWVAMDELARMLRMTHNHLAVSLYRLRREVSELGVADATQLVEVRSPSRSVRLAVSGLHIASTT